MPALNRFVQIFSAPGRVFDDISEGRTSWWQPWLCVSVIYMIVGYLSMPLQRHMLDLNPQDLPPEQLEQQIEFFEKFALPQLLTVPVFVLIMAAAVSGIVYIWVSILSDKASFKQFFSISMYAGIVTSLSGLVATILVRMKGVESVRSAEDAQMSLSLGFLAPEEANILLKAVANSLEFFTIWGLVLIGMGLIRVFEMPQRTAVYAVIPIWIIVVIVSMAGLFFGGMA